MTRLPALPLITSDPYFSVWMPADKLTDADSTHWCGISQPIYGRLIIDGKAYRFLGLGSDEALPTKDIVVTPCTTKAVYETDEIRFVLSFTMPMLPDDLERLSTPICLVKAETEILDGKKHNIDFKLAVSDRMCYTGEVKPDIRYIPMPGKLNIGAIGQTYQKLLCHSFDHITIDWGYLYTACEEAEIAYESGMLTVSKNDISGKTVKVLIGYDDIASILYYGTACKCWYARNGKTITEALRETNTEFDGLIEKSEVLDKKLMKAAFDIGGEDYRLIVCASWRHVFAAHKLISDENGEMVFISKENDSNGCAGTVDVSYPSTPIFLKFCPELVNAMCRPVLRFARTAVWKYDFAPHDVGRYPIVGGQVYGAALRDGFNRREPKVYPPYYLYPAEPEQYLFEKQMPVEESGNMLIMLYAAAFFGADTALIKDNMDLCEKWVRYLIENGEDPGNQLCTDDFAGHLAHNVNLSAKAIVGIACYGKLLEIVGRDGSEYLKMAHSMAESWLARCSGDDGTYLTFEKVGWSMKYNLAWDKVFRLGLLSDEFYDRETRSYLKRINEYGLPLDNRAVYTKSDWELWTASMAEDKEVRTAIIAPVAKFLRETKSRVAFSDWYFTDSGLYRAFIARSVQGGLYMPFLVNSCGDK